jgi:hypothetical protein
MFMETSTATVKRRRGTQLSTAEKMALTERIAKLMGDGIDSIHGLALRLNVNTTTVRRYKPYAERLYGHVSINSRTYHRNLQIRRTLAMVELLTIDLEAAQTVKEKMLIHNQLVKYYHLMALLSGILYEAKEQPTGHGQLVIVRPAMASA